LNPIQVEARSRVTLKVQQDSLTSLGFTVERVAARGEVHSSEGFTLMATGVARVVTKGRICTGNLRIDGKALIDPPLGFEVRPGGTIVVIGPREKADGSFMDVAADAAINNVEARVGTRKESQVGGNYVEYRGMMAYTAPKRLTYVGGERFVASSENSFDIHQLRVSPLGIELVGGTRGRDIRLGEEKRRVSESLLENLPRSALLVFGIVYFFLDKVVLGILVNAWSKKHHGTT
jgi:hypothetical protein